MKPMQRWVSFVHVAHVWGTCGHLSDLCLHPLVLLRHTPCSEPYSLAPWRGVSVPSLVGGQGRGCLAPRRSAL